MSFIRDFVAVMLAVVPSNLAALRSIGDGAEIADPTEWPLGKKQDKENIEYGK